MSQINSDIQRKVLIEEVSAETLIQVIKTAVTQAIDIYEHNRRVEYEVRKSEIDHFAEQQVFTITEAAEYLRMSVSTLKKKIADKKIKIVDDGGNHRVTRQSINDYLRANEK